MPTHLPSILLLVFLAGQLFAGTLRVGTYNLQNYTTEFRMREGHREPEYPKPEREKTALRTVIQAAGADILAVQEIGGAAFVAELQRDLARQGCHYPHTVTLAGPDEKRQLAILSRHPFKQIHRHPRLAVRYNRTEDEVSRGLLGVTITTGTGDLTLYTLHLKSRLTADADDPRATAQRAAEATAVRARIRAFMGDDTAAHVLVLGDFNDTPTSGTLRRFTHIGKNEFLRMWEPQDSRREVWTYHSRRDGYYSRSDYLLSSPALAAHIREVRIADLPAGDTASDHRLVYADLEFP